MRDIAVVLFFVVASMAAFRRPYYGALLWVLFGLMNPHRMTYGFAFSLPFAQLVVIVTVLAAWRHRQEVRWPRGAPIVLILIFLVWMSVTTLTAIAPDPSIRRYIEVLKVLGMTILVAALVRTREEIIGLVWVIALSIGYFGFKGGLFTIATGGSHRVWGPPSSLVQGNNELAIALIMTIPLIYFLTTNPGLAREFRPVSRISERLIRWGGYGGMLLCAAAALGSQSRGALLSIAAMGLMLWLRSKAKLSIGVILVLAVGVAIPMLPDTWFDRMETIKTYEEDMSAMQRINSWETAVNIANDRVTGAGFATANQTVFSRYSPRGVDGWVLVAHSIYFQVLGDHGWIGLAMYLSFWATTYFGAGRVAKRARLHADLAWVVSLMNMCKVSMVGFAVGGAFLSLAYWDMPYYLMVLVVVAGLLVKAKSQVPVVGGSVSGVNVGSASQAPGWRR